MAVRDMVPTLAWPTIERRFLLGGIAAAMAAALVLLLTQPPERSPILVAGSDMPAGTPLASLDIDVRYVEAPDGLVSGTDIGDLATWSLRVPIVAGEPLTASNLRPPEALAAPSLIALALPEEQAVLGRIGAGDLLDVYVTTRSAAGSETTTERVATDVYVAEVVLPTEGSLDSDVKLLLAVDDHLAAILAANLHSGDLDLVRVGP